MLDDWKLEKQPIQQELETRRVLKSLPKAHVALAELKGIASTIPNQHILIKTLGLQEDLGVTRVTASNYLNKLSRDGILSKEKIGNSNYYINEPLFELLTKR